MRNFLKVVLLGFGFVALAQDRVVTARTVDVDVTGTEVFLLPDAGCLIRPMYQNTGSVRERRASYPYNGAKCANLMAAAERAAWLDLGVADGGRP